MEEMAFQRHVLVSDFPVFSNRTPGLRLESGRNLEMDELVYSI